MEKEKGTIKHDLFVTDLWEFDFPYHDQFKPQVLEFVSSPEAQDHIRKHTLNPSLTSYGGDELCFGKDRNLFSFFQTQVLKLLKRVEEGHEWDEGEWDRVDPWLNINQKGNFNPPHAHPGNDYSGCYYVTFPKNSGFIHFLDPRPQHRFSSPNPGRPQGALPRKQIRRKIFNGRPQIDLRGSLEPLEPALSIRAAHFLRGSMQQRRLSF